MADFIGQPVEHLHQDQQPLHDHVAEHHVKQQLLVRPPGAAHRSAPVIGPATPSSRWVSMRACSKSAAISARSIGSVDMVPAERGCQLLNARCAGAAVSGAVKPTGQAHHRVRLPEQIRPIDKDRRRSGEPQLLSLGVGVNRRSRTSTAARPTASGASRSRCRMTGRLGQPSTNRTSTSTLRYCAC